MRARGPAAISWALAMLAAIALAAGGLLAYFEHTAFRSEPFADRVAATLDAAPVRSVAARQLTNVVLNVRPNLVALRPLIELGAASAVGSPPFRALVRRAALDAHRSAFDEHSREVNVRLRDAGVVLAAAIDGLRPDVAKRIPTAPIVTLARIKGRVDGFLLRLAERADDVRRGQWVAFAAALALAAGVFALGGSRRASMLRLGVALGAVGGVVALASALGPTAAAARVKPGDREAVRAALAVWLDPLTVWSVAALGAGAIVAYSAVALERPLSVTATLRRARDVATRPPRTALGRLGQVVAALAVGAAMIAWPRRVLTIVIVATGALVVLAAVSRLLALAVGPPEPAARRRGGARRAVRAGVAAGVLVAVGLAVAAVVAGDETPAFPRVGRCNGYAALCDRRVDQVAFLATHNSMAAAGEPRWLFAAQDAGIPQQLADGVRGLLIDTHYGIGTGRGVYTELGANTRAKLAAEAGEQLVTAAERVRRSIGRNPTGKREIFLCHTFCEVGATKALGALQAAHRFLVMHPEEVLVLSIQDETSSADTAALIRASGLVDEVYRGPAARPWPTLRELVDRDQRAIVLAENQTGGAPWIHHQPAVVQETPYRFTTVRALGAPDSCRPNRGGTAGSLLLVNHWVDTSPAPRVTIAREVNAHDFLARRLSLCRRSRGMLPNLVAVDFYREGDAARAVDELNRVGAGR